MTHDTTLVLGLGNELLRDDGVGLCAARRVDELMGPRAELEEACVSTLDLLPVLRDRRRVVVVDAYVSELDPPGTAVHAAPEWLPHGFGYRSLHNLSFADMLSLGRRLDWPMPEYVSIHGLCVADPWTFGATFTPPVERAWRAWADRIAALELATSTATPDLHGPLGAATPREPRRAAR
jgi:hydrogenase maturation protease